MNFNEILKMDLPCTVRGHSIRLFSIPVFLAKNVKKKLWHCETARTAAVDWLIDRLIDSGLRRVTASREQ